MWKVTFPSTFCNTWWMWPLSTVSEPNRFRVLSTCSASRVPQPHFSYTVQRGTWANTTTGVLSLSPSTSFFNHSS